MEKLKIAVQNSDTVSGLLLKPNKLVACFVFAHGAGAGMDHPFMSAVAKGLCDRSIATLRFQFPYMERSSKRPDSPSIAQATVRAAVEEASKRFPKHPIIAGGKSFGGRMTSQAEATTPFYRVKGLAFFGFPLHPAGKPSMSRAEHLVDIKVPMLFLQGSRDALADLKLLKPLVKKLGPKATLQVFEEADHSFHVPKRSGKTDAEVLNEMLAVFAGWAGEL